jgi:hypothetical protein
MCLVTRTVHINVVEDLSTSAFLNCFRVFAMARGWPDTVYSDNGTNFVGAQKELLPTVESLAAGDEFQSEMVQRGVKWTRYPPHAPHWGGVHEAMVKAAKKALRHALDMSEKRRLLREHELITIYAEVTIFLNDRPLTYASDDPKDGYLTPAHFLYPGRYHPNAEPPPGLVNAGPYRESYERVQWIVNEIWRVWLMDYLPTLMTRAKWQTRQRDAMVNDIVLVLDDNMPRGHWRMGRVVEVFRGKNGYVRSCRLRTIRRKRFDKDGNIMGLRGDSTINPSDHKYIDRPITRLVLLRAADQEPALPLPAVPAVINLEDED